MPQSSVPAAAFGGEETRKRSESEQQHCRQGCEAQADFTKPIQSKLGKPIYLLSAHGRHISMGSAYLAPAECSAPSVLLIRKYRREHEFWVLSISEPLPL
jgi:hypothetical protein